MAVWFVASELFLHSDLIENHALRLATAGLIACVVFVTINHFLLAVMLHFARGHTLKETGLFDIENLSTDLVLAALGVATYAFWETNQWLIPFAVAPLVLVHRSLAVPQLQADARVDPKTALFNARHFATALPEEIGRARRLERPMPLFMADLAVYRAKLQGRNRVLGASPEPFLVPAERSSRLVAVPEDGDHHAPIPAAAPVQPKEERRAEMRHPRPHAMHGPRFLSLDRRLSLTVGLVSTFGVGAGVVGFAFSWTARDLLGLLAVLLLVGVGQALALEADEGAAVLSVSAVGCLAASSLFGWRAALPLAITSDAV